MDEREIKSIIEALLFTWGDPLEIRDIAKILDMKNKEVENILDEMIDDFNYNRRGLRIVKMGNSYQIGTRPEHYDWIKRLQKENPPKSLSSAALETLSIIAYKQPVIKSEIDHIRGVKSDKAIQTLIERDLVEEQGRLEKTGRPIIYGTTDEFLKLFSLESVEELPELQEIRRQLVEEEVSDEMEE